YDNERLRGISHKLVKGGVDLANAAGREKFDLLPNGRSRGTQFRSNKRRGRISRIDKRGIARRGRSKFLQESEPLRAKLCSQEGYARDISARPVQARHDPRRDRIT